MSDIFISYSRKNIDLVSNMASVLEELGYSVWWDVSRLHGGQQFAKVIQQEINKAQCVIVVWSKTSVESKWVHAEASLADGREVLLTTSCEDAAIPLPFNTRHNEDLRDWSGNPLDDKFQKLLQAVNRYCPTPSQSIHETEHQELLEPIFLKQEQNTPKKPATSLYKGMTVGIIVTALAVAGFVYTQNKDGKPTSLDVAQTSTISAPASVAPAPIKPEPKAEKQYQLSIKTTPNDAVITVNGKAYQPDAQWKSGDYQINVTAEHYKTIEKSITISSQDKQVNIELTPDRLPFEPEMVSIPAGTFTMGCIDERDDVEGGCYSWEKLPHEVSINAFQMGKYEITVGQYMACVDADVCSKPRRQEKDVPDYYKALGDGLTNENYPIVGVSWNNAKAYAEWLRKKTGKSYRLVTEAEWEYAARGGDNAIAYPWGNKASHEYMNYGKDKWEYTSPVGSFPANDFGLYDMHGNVFEWVQDAWHGDYKGAPVNGEVWKKSEDSDRVMRGGSWYDAGRSARSAFRYHRPPDYRYSSIGFRVALGRDLKLR